MWSPLSFFCSLSHSHSLHIHLVLASSLSLTLIHAFYPSPSSHFLHPSLLSLPDDGSAPAVDYGAYSHRSLVCFTCGCWGFGPSCAGSREARPCWHCEEGVSSCPDQAEETLDLELSLRWGGKTGAHPLQDRTGKLTSLTQESSLCFWSNSWARLTQFTL